MIDLHPQLFPCARAIQKPDGPELHCQARPEVPDGWRDVVELACARLAAAVGKGPGRVEIDEVREKWGTMRMDVVCEALPDQAWEAVDLAVELAEARSAHVCTACGGRGRLWSSQGWLITRCDEHGEGRPLPMKPYVIATWRGRSESIARLYDFDSDSFVPCPVPEDFSK